MRACTMSFLKLPPHARLDHLVVSLRSTNELQVDGISDPEIANELSEDILSIWPHGVTHQGFRRGKWKVQFAGSPWSSVGLDAVLYASSKILRISPHYSHSPVCRAGKLLIRLSVCLARVVSCLKTRLCLLLTLDMI